jgi:CBS domain containing-hemolysin-like protein
MLVLSGLFSGAETGIYQLSRLRLRLGIENKRLLYVLLGKAMHDSSGLLLSMLISNNLVNYFITSIVTYLYVGRLNAEYAAELFATITIVPILFVFGELLPKNIVFYRADSIMPYLAPIVWASHKLLSWCGAVPLLKAMSSVFVRLTGTRISSTTVITAVQRHHVRSIFQDTQEEGILSSVQYNIINRLVSISHVRVRSIMTPINRVQMVDVKSDKSALLAKLKQCEFTRLLVYEHRGENIVGFINIYEALSWPDSFGDVHGFVKPIRKLGANISVIDAINIMRSENQKVVLVVRKSHTGRERPIGIVTMKDLAEELLGELAQW